MSSDGKQNENSLFAGIMPKQEPPRQAEAPRPVPAAPPPAPQETLGAVKKLMGDFEKSLLDRLDKKLAEPPQAAAQEAPPVSSLLLKKIEELESRLKSYQERNVIPAAQLKAAEEARISGRREIEELLKAVREQQKFSELDRQMHEQLQKSWSRAEELERKLLEIYEVSARPAAAPPPSPVVPQAPAPPPPPALDAEALKELVASTVLGRLERRLAGLEERLMTASSAADSAFMRGEKKGRDSAEDLKSEFKGFLSELRGELERGFVSGAAELRIAADGVSGNVRESVAEALREEARLGVEHMQSVLSRLREREDALVRRVVERLDLFAVKGEEHSVAISETCAAAARNRTAIERELMSLRSVVKEETELIRKSVTAELAANSARVVEETRRALVDASLRLEKAGGAASALARARVGLETVCGAISAAAVELDKLNLESLLGVSGVILRRNVRALRDALDKIGPECESLSAAERELSGAVRRRDEER